MSIDSRKFEQEKGEFEAALSNSAFTENLQFSKSNAQPRKNRKRNIIWFNPPFNQAVQNKIGREFTSLIEKLFPPITDTLSFSTEVIFD